MQPPDPPIQKIVSFRTPPEHENFNLKINTAHWMVWNKCRINWLIDKNIFKLLKKGKYGCIEGKRYKNPGIYNIEFRFPLKIYRALR
jgi:hypothetical protein